MNLTKDTQLRTLIAARMQELDYKPSFLCNDAKERGFDMKPDRLSKYLKGKSGGLTEEGVLWLACRLYIPVQISYGRPVYRDGKLYYEVPKYDELEALKLVNRVFTKE